MINLLETLIAFISLMLMMSLLVTSTLKALNSGDFIKYWIMKNGMKKLAEHIAQETSEKEEIQREIQSSIDTAIGKGIARTRNAYTSFDELYDTYQQAPGSTLDKEKVESWFTLVEDETRGLFKTYSDISAFLIAAAFVFILQLDAINIFNEIQNKPNSESQEISASAEVLTDIDTDKSSSDDASVPSGLEAFPNGLTIDFYLEHWAGLLVSTILISLGAPFWFNTLKNVVGLKDAVAMRYEKKKE